MASSPQSKDTSINFLEGEFWASPAGCWLAASFHHSVLSLAADKGKMGNEIYHKVNLGLLIATPVAVITSPSVLSHGLDLALGVGIPLHAHIGMNAVITDYVPKSVKGPARAALLGVTGLTVIGLTYLNISGPGITESIKALWKGPKGEKVASES